MSPTLAVRAALPDMPYALGRGGDHHLVLGAMVPVDQAFGLGAALGLESL